MLEALAQYKILDRLGAGGMGDVYRARDTRLGRTVAIKVLVAGVADDADRRARFLGEARAAASLSHPNIAALYEIGEDQGRLFLVFEFVPGETLKTVIGGRPLNPRRAVDLAIQIADALAEAHADGIVHRDIKPSNVVVTPKGNAKVLDFGLATWTAGGTEREQAATALATTAGGSLGTVAYLSPEQALGEQVDQRTDIFSLGIVLFEMLTGRLPFTGSTPSAVALQIVQAAPPALSAVDRSLPPELDVVMTRALAKSLDQRYEAAATVAAELRSIAAILETRSGPSEPVSAHVPVMPRRRSHAGWIVLLLLLAAALAAWVERDAIQRFLRDSFGASLRVQRGQSPPNHVRAGDDDRHSMPGNLQALGEQRRDGHGAFGDQMFGLHPMRAWARKTSMSSIQVSSLKSQVCPVAGIVQTSHFKLETFS